MVTGLRTSSASSSLASTPAAGHTRHWAAAIREIQHVLRRNRFGALFDPEGCLLVQPRTLPVEFQRGLPQSTTSGLDRVPRPLSGVCRGSWRNQGQS